VYLTFRQLKYFVEVVDAGSITKAAERLHVTSTALSLQVKELEDQFRVSLLRRHSRGIEMTTSGADLYDRALKILELVDDASHALSADAPIPNLRLGAPPSIARMIGVEAMLGAASWLGGVSVDVTEGWTIDLESRLASGDLDAVVGYDLSASDSAQVTDIVEDVFVFIAAPSLAGGEGPIAMRDVLASELVFYGEQSVSYRGARSAAAAAGLELASERHVHSINVWRSMLTRGLATTIGSVAAVDDEYRHGEVVIREIEGNPIRSKVGIAVRTSLAGQARVQAFTDFVRKLVIEGLRHDWTDIRAGYVLHEN
jgi:LysR family nitrogen assimilation transcriptional regulator